MRLIAALFVMIFCLTACSGGGQDYLIVQDEKDNYFACYPVSERVIIMQKLMTAEQAQGMLHRLCSNGCFLSLSKDEQIESCPEELEPKE